jgi:hypothetical protein
MNPMSSQPFERWHMLLRALAGLNLALLTLSAIAVTGIGWAAHAGTDFATRIQLLLCTGYVVGCAYRSVLPVFDIPRQVVFDSPLSSVLVGRSVATVAELCFAAQWALILHRLALSGGSALAQSFSLAIVPLIVCAEVCSWHAVLTTSQQGHVMENSLWGLAAALVVSGLLGIGPLRLTTVCPPAIAWCAGAAVYVAFMFFIDVPMYWTRWRVDQASGRHALSLAQGMVDVSQRRVVSRRWEDWKGEALWMSLYFSFGVWSSISLVDASAALAAG